MSQSPDGPQKFEQSVRQTLDRLQPQLPMPPAAALELSAHLSERLRADILRSGPMSFAQFMQRCLYEPGLGYYSAGLTKFGEAGDFVTAPELSPLFSRTLARQCTEILAGLKAEQASSGPAHVLEIGAGRGVMAAAMLRQWADDDALPAQYFILEVSADLRACQQQTLREQVPELMACVHWLDAWPQAFSGVVLGNEVLDALPVAQFHYVEGQLFERAVGLQQDELALLDVPPSPALTRWFAQLPAELLASWPGDYFSEAPLLQNAWLAALANSLDRAVVLLIDYGFPAHEFYLPERNQGTLMCHYRHHAHSDPLCLLGLQDLTAHVDFSAVADQAFASGMSIAGFDNQAAFLQNAGILQLVDTNADARAQFSAAQQLKRLLLPSEMGELFKVIALNKNTDIRCSGFGARDNRHRL